MKNITIGIPRGLLNYRYKYLWIAFFKELNVNILVSPKSNNELLNLGNTLIKEDTCILLKLFMGHVYYLKDKVDYILIPRVPKDKNCFFFNSLYDITNNLMDINTLCLNIEKEELEKEEYIKLGTLLGFGKIESENAYKNAKKEEYKKNKINYLIQEEKIKKDKNKVLIISDDYLCFDNLISNIIFKNIRKNDQVIYSCIVNPDLSRKNSYNLVHLYNIERLKKLIYKTLYITTDACVSKNDQKLFNIIKIDNNFMENIYE